MELALSLEKLVSEKLLNLHNVRQSLLDLSFYCMCIVSLVSFMLTLTDIVSSWQVASKTGDVQLADFVESEFLVEQVCKNLVLWLTNNTYIQSKIIHNYVLCIAFGETKLNRPKLCSYVFLFLYRWKPLKKSQSMLLSLG